MSNMIKRFVREGIRKQQLKRYGVVHKIDNGRYYEGILSAYDYEDAKRIFKKKRKDIVYFEVLPDDFYKEIIDSNELYSYEIGV